MFPWSLILKFIGPMLINAITHPQSSQAHQIAADTHSLVATTPDASADQSAQIAHLQQQIKVLTQSIQLMVDARAAAGALPHDKASESVLSQQLQQQQILKPPLVSYTVT